MQDVVLCMLPLSHTLPHTCHARRPTGNSTNDHTAAKHEHAHTHALASTPMLHTQHTTAPVSAIITSSSHPSDHRATAALTLGLLPFVVTICYCCCLLTPLPCLLVTRSLPVGAPAPAAAPAACTLAWRLVLPAITLLPAPALLPAPTVLPAPALRVTAVACAGISSARGAACRALAVAAPAAAPAGADVPQLPLTLLHEQRAAHSHAIRSASVKIHTPTRHNCPLPQPSRRSYTASSDHWPHLSPSGSQHDRQHTLRGHYRQRSLKVQS
jgi:hypothetical protein